MLKSRTSYYNREAMRIAFMGTSQFSVPALEKLIASGHEVVAVYTRPDRLAGRGRKQSLTPVKEVALGQDIPVFQPETLKNASEIDRLTGLKPDVIIVVAFGQILPQDVLDIPSFGCLNIHPSLLPKYRGASPIVSAILAGDEQTGVTIMLLDAGMDTGPVLAQRKIFIDSEDTAGSLEAKLAEVGADILIGTLSKWFEHKLVPERQDNRRAIYTGQISKRDGELDWGLPAVELARRARAFYPWPGCYTNWKGKTLRILKAVPLSATAQIEPGIIVGLSSEGEVSVGVGTGEGLLGLRQVQIEGKKAMPAADFMRGQKGFVGGKLG